MTSTGCSSSIFVAARCCPAGWDKRFTRGKGAIADRVGGELTARQRSCLNAMVFRYRRQIGAKVVAKAALRLAAEQAEFRLEAAGKLHVVGEAMSA